ncbi:MAG: amidohydrolase family protein, partial [Blastocatellia bacterium]|nr:amidohydrolase family protein [Blastocatellia bacterium]
MKPLLIGISLMLTLLWSTASQPPTYDLLIRNGRIVDGTGNPSFVGDVALRDGRIAALGKLTNAAAKRTIDAQGLIVAPGFIDIHNHSDDTILEDGNAESMVRQGVTSMIFGEGLSAAPTAKYKDFASYFADVQKRGVATNIGSYIGSGTVWLSVHGDRGGKATAEELQRMRAVVKTAMEQGALGVASSLSGPPGVWIDTDTLVAMCEVAGQYGGIYSTHMRTEGEAVFKAVAEALEIGRRAQLPVDIIHLKIAEHKLWGKMPDLVALLAKTRAEGQLVEANVYPYRAGQNNLSSIIPPWAHEGGAQAMIQRLQDPSLRPRLESEILNGIPNSDWYNHYTATGGWDGMLLVTLKNPKYKQFQGKRMSEVIQALNKPPLDVLFELLRENNGSVPTVYFHHSEDDMKYALKQPFVSIGSDGTAVKTEGPLAAGHPHPRYYGTFPRVLGKYVREEKLFNLAEAIRKMTSLPARALGLKNRGTLQAGNY